MTTQLKHISTPWGTSDHVQDIGRGILSVDTPSHGGYFVPTSLLPAIPEAHQKRAEYWSGSRNWYEEDCEWASVAVAFPDLFDEKAREAAAQTIAWRDREGAAQ